jgi:TRAP-type mannitol/chloroaromatic compound transport system permease large subunit
VSRDRTESRTHVRIVRGYIPAWLALVLVVPAALLFAVSLAIVVAVGLIGALLLPLAWRRLDRARPRDADCIELDPDDFHTVERRDRLPPS